MLFGIPHIALVRDHRGSVLCHFLSLPIILQAFFSSEALGFASRRGQTLDIGGHEDKRVAELKELRVKGVKGVKGTDVLSR